MKKFLAAITFIVVVASGVQALALYLEGDGIVYVPVVVTVRYGDTGVTEGLEVRLLNAGKAPKDLTAVSAWERTIAEGLGKPVLTDKNSTAVVWMRIYFGISGDKSYKKDLPGILVLGPKDKPLFNKSLIDLLKDDPRIMVDRVDSPLVIMIDLNPE